MKVKNKDLGWPLYFNGTNMWEALDNNVVISDAKFWDTADGAIWHRLRVPLKTQLEGSLNLLLKND